MKHGFLEKIEDGIYERMKESIAADDSFAQYNYDAECGVIEVYVNDRNETEVIVTHYADAERVSPNIETAVTEVISDWNEVYNEVMEEASTDHYWNDHGFASATAYETWKFGHGGLR